MKPKLLTSKANCVGQNILNILIQNGKILLTFFNNWNYVQNLRVLFKPVTCNSEEFYGG
jgi:hypothetical protein